MHYENDFERNVRTLLLQMPIIPVLLSSGASVFGGIFRKLGRFYSKSNDIINNELLLELKKSDIDIIILASKWDKITDLVRKNYATKSVKDVPIGAYGSDKRYLITMNYLDTLIVLDISVVEQYKPIYAYACDTLAYGNKAALGNSVETPSRLGIYSLLSFGDSSTNYSPESCWMDILNNRARAVMPETRDTKYRKRQIERTVKLSLLGYNIDPNDHAKYLVNLFCEKLSEYPKPMNDYPVFKKIFINLYSHLEEKLHVSENTLMCMAILCNDEEIVSLLLNEGICLSQITQCVARLCEKKIEGLSIDENEQENCFENILEDADLISEIIKSYPILAKKISNKTWENNVGKTANLGVLKSLKDNNIRLLNLDEKIKAERRGPCKDLLIKISSK